MTKKSLLITNDFPPIVSGIATAFYQLWMLMPADNIVIMSPQVKNSADFDRNQPFKILRKWIPIGESPIAKLVKSIIIAFYAIIIVKKLKVDKLHCGQLISTGLAGLLCKRLFNIPYAVYVYGSETARFGGSKPVMKFVSKIIDEAEQLIPNSEFTLNEFLRFGVKKEKMVKITPGVDTEFFYPKEKSCSLQKKYNLKDQKVLLTVSRLDERKGNDMVIKALVKVLKKYPDTKYIIVGKGREESALKSIAKGLNLFGSGSHKDKVVFAGYVDDKDLPDYYNLCDIFIMPNRETVEHKQLRGDFEGFGIVFMEASACAKPVIAGKSGGVEEAVEEGVSGLFVDPNSIEDIADTIIRLFDDKELSERLANNGRLRAKLHYDWRLLSKTLLRIL